MPRIIQTLPQSSTRSDAQMPLQEPILLALACISMCVFAIALSVGLPAISEAVALLS
jgi:hypothetical protein